MSPNGWHGSFLSGTALAQPDQSKPCQPSHAWRSHAFAGVIFALFFVVLANVRPFSRWNDPEAKHYFAAAISAPADGVAQVSCRFFGGLRPTPSGRARIVKSETPRIVMMEVPGEELRAVLFEAFLPGESVEIRDAQIVDADMQVIHRFAATDAKPAVPGSLEITGEGALRLKLVRGASLIFTPASPILPSGGIWPGWPLAIAEFLVAGVLFSVLCALLSMRFPGRAARFTAATAEWASGNPGTAVFLAALAAVVVSCHPVIFLGRSFVSPNNGATALYDDFPSLPGSTDVEVEDSAGSDLGAMMWAFLPYSAMQHEALACAEWPLRNRYACCGLGLQGQGISMFGDPLHLIPVAANGAMWAWDVKFILAKLLFAFGAGLIAFTVTRHTGIAVLLAASSPFIGFFAYRFNHAAFFTLCYSPWILLAWLRAAGSTRPRDAWKWALLLAASGFAVLNSGALKEATILLLTLNAAGALATLLRATPLRERIATVAVMALGNMAFVLVSAPFWLPFVDLLRQARTVYDDPKVFQIQPSLLIGLFDDLFYRQLQPREQHFAPSGNFLLLLGVLWSLVRWRRLAAREAWLAPMLIALPSLAVVFGAVPPSWISALPLLGKIWHVDNCFTLPVIVLGFAIAACGLQECMAPRRASAWRGDWLAFALLLGSLYAFYFGLTHAAHRSGFSLLAVGDTVAKSPFFIGYASGLALAILILPWLLRNSPREGRGAWAWLLGFACLFPFHFRHSMHGGTKLDAYVMNPQPRMDIHARSPAIEAVRRKLATTGEPGRIAGLGGTLSPDFNAVYGLETPFGCDAVMNRLQWELADAAGFTRLWGWRIVLGRPHFPALLPMLDLFNVRFYLATPSDDSRPLPGLTALGVNDLAVHESRTAWPRAFFTDRVARYGNVADFVKLVASSEARPLAAVENGQNLPAVVDRLGDDTASRSVVPATDYTLTPNTTAFRIKAPSEGLVTLSEAFEEGNYLVTVNGVPAEVQRVNHAFLGVVVPAPGEYAIRFTYRPRLWSAALWSATAGILLLAAMLAAAIRRGEAGRPG